MENLIKDRRRIEITLHDGSYSDHIGRYLYNRNGKLLKVLEGTQPKKELDELLSALCRKQPEASGYETEVTSDNGIHLSAEIRRYIDMTLGELADIQAVRIGENDAVIDCKNNCSLTFRRIKLLSDQLAKAFIQIGILKGDHVAVIVDNSWEGIITKVALEKTGAVIVNLNIHEKEQMLETLLSKADVRTAIIKCGIKAREHLDMICDICPEFQSCQRGKLHAERLPNLRHLITIDAKEPLPFVWQFEKLLESGEAVADQVLLEREKTISPFDDASIIHTSGTSGVPKGVVLTHAQLMENAWNHVIYMGLTSEDRFFMTSPFFHSLGCVGCVMTCILAGAAVLFYDRIDAERLLPILSQQACTVLCSVPTIYVRLIQKMKRENTQAHSLHIRLCLTAGAPCSRQTLTELKHYLGTRDIMVMYGMTEAGPGITSTSLGDSMEIVASTVGRLWPGVQGKIIDLESKEPLDPGKPGEICVKSFCVMRGYYNNPEETKNAIDPDGWLHTGDIGVLSEDGILTLKGRCKDLIICGGENVSPKEVEDFLRGHDAIEDVAVVGVPDEQYGENVCAFLKLAPGKRLTCEELEAWCKGKIATIKIPKQVEILDEFPVSATGKISKAQLRKIAAANVTDQ